MKSAHATPKRSNSPIFWLLFGAGGMLSALFGPALIMLTGIMAPHGWGMAANFADYAHVMAFAQNPIGKLLILAVIALFFWHGAERLFFTLKDMRAGNTLLLTMATYGVAAVLSLVTLVLLLGVGF